VETQVIRSPISQREKIEIKARKVLEKILCLALKNTKKAKDKAKKTGTRWE
jgi:hypothetical protein